MLNLFKRTTPLQKLQQEYERLLKEAHKLSSINRRASDEKHAEAQEVLNRIEAMRNNKSNAS